MTICHFGNDLKLLFVKREPSRIVRRRIDYCSNLTRRKILLQLCLQLIATIVVHIEMNGLYTQNHTLLLLNRKAGVDKQNLVLLCVQAGKRHKSSKATLHTSHRRHTTILRYFHIKKVLHKPRSLMFKLLSSVNVGIDCRTTVFQSLNFGINTYLYRRKSGNTHLHSHELLTRCSFHIVNNLLDLSD